MKQLCRVYAGSSLLFCGMMLGCSSTNTYPPAGQVDPVRSEDYPQIVPLDGLSRYLGFSEPSVRHGPPLSVSVPVRLLKAQPPINVQYRFLFLSEDGRDVSTNSDWRFVTLQPQVRAFMTGTAIDDRAVDWNLEVRSAR